MVARVSVATPQFTSRSKVPAYSAVRIETHVVDFCEGSAEVQIDVGPVAVFEAAGRYWNRIGCVCGGELVFRLQSGACSNVVVASRRAV